MGSRFPSNSAETCPGLQSLHSPTEFIRDLLHSNIEPEPAVSKQIQANLVQAVKEYDKFSSQWTESQRTGHEEAIRLYRSVSSVVRRLPNDILRLIFLAVVENIKPRDRLDTKTGAWSISRVCARWREVALSTPSLWSTIHLEARRCQWLAKLPISTVSTIVDACLSRAGKAALNLFVSNSTSDKLQFNPIYPLICLHAWQWECATFCPLSDSLLDWFSIVESVPLLKQITFIIDGAQIDPQDKRLEFLSSAPCLQHVRLFYTCSTEIQLPQQFPWEQLLSFTLTTGVHTTVLKLSEVLPRCTKLLELKISCPEFVLITSLVVMPYLTSLTLRLTRVIKGLHYVIVPSLKYFTLDVCQFFDDDEVDVSMILRNSQCSLLEFCYTCFNVSPHIVERYLKAAPTLRVLTLDVVFGTGVQYDLLLLLTCRENEDVIAPKLEDVSLTIPHEPDLTELVDAMIASRSARGKFKFTALPPIGSRQTY